MNRRSNLRVKSTSLLLLLLICNIISGQNNPSAQNGLLTIRLQQQAKLMGQAFIKGDYQTFAIYTYPALVSAMGGKRNIYANKSAKSDTTSIISQSQIAPFVIYRQSLYVKLPHSIKGQIISGLCVIQLNINEKGLITSFFIKKFYLVENKKVSINWFNVDDLPYQLYPLTIKKYYSYFKLYVKTLKVVPNRIKTASKKNIISILIRLK